MLRLIRLLLRRLVLAVRLMMRDSRWRRRRKSMRTSTWRKRKKRLMSLLTTLSSTSRSRASGKWRRSHCSCRMQMRMELRRMSTMPLQRIPPVFLHRISKSTLIRRMRLNVRILPSKRRLCHPQALKSLQLLPHQSLRMRLPKVKRQGVPLRRSVAFLPRPHGPRRWLPANTVMRQAMSRTMKRRRRIAPARTDRAPRLVGLFDQRRRHRLARRTTRTSL